MTEIKIGHARVSTDARDLTTQRAAPAALDVTTARIDMDHGPTGTTRAWPGQCRLPRRWHPVITKLDRLARSLSYTRDNLPAALRP